MSEEKKQPGRPRKNSQPSVAEAVEAAVEKQKVSEPEYKILKEVPDHKWMCPPGSKEPQSIHNKNVRELENEHGWSVVA